MFCNDVQEIKKKPRVCKSLGVEWVKYDDKTTVALQVCFSRSF